MEDKGQKSESVAANDYPGMSAMCLTYGRVRALEEAIQSFLLQDYPGPKELVILNDLPEQILQFDHPEVQIVNVSQRFETLGQKRDICARLATYDWLMPWDDDDVVLPHRMRCLMQQIKDKNLSFFNNRRHLFVQGGKMIINGWKLASACCFSRELFNEVGGYLHMSAGEDRAFESACKSRGHTTIFEIPDDELSYIYRWGMPYHTSNYHSYETKEVLREIYYAIDRGRDISQETKQKMRFNPETEVRKNTLQRIQKGREPSGIILLKPSWSRDYVGMFKELLRARAEQSKPVDTMNDKPPISQSNAKSPKPADTGKSKPISSTRASPDGYNLVHSDKSQPTQWGWLQDSIKPGASLYLLANEPACKSTIEALQEVLHPDDCVVHFNKAIWRQQFKQHPNNVLVLNAFPGGYHGQGLRNDTIFARVYFHRGSYNDNHPPIIESTRLPKTVFFGVENHELAKSGYQGRIPEDGITIGFTTYFMNQMYHPILVGFTSFVKPDGVVPGHKQVHCPKREKEWFEQHGARYFDRIMRDDDGTATVMLKCYIGPGSYTGQRISTKPVSLPKPKATATKVVATQEVKKPLTIATVLKSGGKDRFVYVPEHVYRLQKQIAKYRTKPYNFVCLSDLELDCPCIPLKHNWPGWWSKLELFLHDFGPTVFIDLDTTITDNLDWLDTAPQQFSMVDDFFSPKLFNSGMMAWTGASYKHIAEQFTPEMVARYKDDPLGDGNWIRSRAGGTITSLQKRFPGKIVSYKVSGYAKGASVVCFHGVPKPWDVEGPIANRESNIKTSGTYFNGINRAHKVARADERKTLLKKWFGCPLYGTFNIRTSADTSKIPPTITDGIHRFYYLRLRVKDKQVGELVRYGWGYRWDGSQQVGTVLEVYTKTLLSDQFKRNPIEITMLQRWNKEEITKWQKDKYWFQGFEWLPTQRADSKRVWESMKNDDYSGKTVLDYGTHHGYFAFQASRAGAIVEAIDKDPEVILRAIEINESIEQQDILFGGGDKIPDGNWDYIFELSVYHQIDQSYNNLAAHIEQLRSRCRVLYIELINPPLSNNLTREQVDEIVGSKPLLHYKHNVRRTRSLYRLSGYVK